MSSRIKIGFLAIAVAAMVAGTAWWILGHRHGHGFARVRTPARPAVAAQQPSAVSTQPAPAESLQPPAVSAAEPPAAPQPEAVAAAQPVNLALAPVAPAPASAPAAAPEPPPPQQTQEIAGTARMYLAHAPLRVPEVADPDSASNHQILQTMVMKSLRRASAAPPAAQPKP